jgi:hypothetical protein
VVEGKWDAWREIEEIASSGGREKEREGVYPPVAMGSVRKAMEMKEMKGAPSGDDGDEGMTID